MRFDSDLWDLKNTMEFLPWIFELWFEFLNFGSKFEVWFRFLIQRSRLVESKINISRVKDRGLSSQRSRLVEPMTWGLEPFEEISSDSD